MRVINKTLIALAVSAASAGSLQAQQLEEVMVTAQKRVESLQDVPISVAAISGDKIKDAGLQRLGDVANYIPNFSINEQSIGDTITIRGIASGNQAGFEQSVGTFVDGVYRGRSVQSRFAFLDVEMVEVLRGPQGTLFGKNTVAGALNITSARPTEEFETSITATHDLEFDETELTGYVSGPITDTLRGRVAVIDRQLDEGWVENIYYGEDTPGKDEQAARIRLDWDVADKTTLQFRYEYGEFDNEGASPFENLVPGPLTAFGVEGGLNGESNIGSVIPTLDLGTSIHMEGDVEEISFQIDSSFERGDLTAIIARSEYDFERAQDADFSPADVVRFDDDEDFEQTSVEVRFASQFDGPVQLIAGLYYQDADLETDGLTLFSNDTLAALTGGGCAAAGGVTVPYDPYTDDPLAAAGAAAAANAGSSAAVANSCANATLLGPLSAEGVSGAGRYAYMDQNTETWAVFSQIDWNLTDVVTATVGLRYTEEEKDAKHIAYASDFVADQKVPTSNPLVALTASLLGEFVPHEFNDLNRDEDSFTWSVNLQWDVSDAIMVYGSASTGFKAGGFNTFAFDPDPENADFEDEEVITYELGSKMSLLDGSAELNIAVFRTEYDDLQAAVFSGQTTFNVENAAEATTQGIEIDGRWQATDNLLVTGSLGYIDFEFDSFPNQACTNDQFVAFREAAWAGGTNINGAFANNSTCASAGVNDLEGETSAYTPELTAVLSASYTWYVGSDYELVLVGDVMYNDDSYRQDDLDPILEADSTTKVNATARFRPLDGNWEIGIIGKNLTDVDDDFSYGNDTPLFNGAHFVSTMPPRSVALTGTLRF